MKSSHPFKTAGVLDFVRLPTYEKKKTLLYKPFSTQYHIPGEYEKKFEKMAY